MVGQEEVGGSGGENGELLTATYGVLVTFSASTLTNTELFPLSLQLSIQKGK